MGTLSGFVPWVVYWVLVGNIPTAVAAAVALVVAVAGLAAGRVNAVAARPLEVGAIGTFSMLTLLIAVFGEPLIGPWTLTLSIVGLLVIAAISVVTGTPLTAAASAAPGADATRNDLLSAMSTQVTRLWLITSFVMTLSSVVAPIMLGDNAIAVSTRPVSVVFSWIVPAVLFGAASQVSRVLEDRVEAELANPATVRRTTFVAFRELAIDELYYLAREKAEREVGAGMEAYDVKLGGSGVSLTGDESRESWPATYKVRARR